MGASESRNPKWQMAMANGKIEFFAEETKQFPLLSLLVFIRG
jgi:hypothetical protein